MNLLGNYLLSHPDSGMGEIGLEFGSEMPAKDIQQLLSENQLALAKELDRPVIFRVVRSHTEVIPAFKCVGLN